MAVGNVEFPEMLVISGVRLGVAKAGVKPGSNRIDLTVIEICPQATVAGVFTQNAFCAEPVKLCKKYLAENSIRYFVINAGNANACTGELGKIAAEKTCEAIATLTGTRAEQTLPFSTGVIGEPLPYEKIVNALPEALKNLTESGWEAAGKAIMTTDTRPKGAVETCVVDGKTISVVGIAKGAGMIKPNMATMLGYVATDAAVAKNSLQKICTYATNKSFNRITIDGDTSTNDSCMLIATGKSETPVIDDENSGAYQALQDAVTKVFASLAQQIVRDGEGATKYLTVQVDGGANQKDCLSVAYAICHSPLVKTALFASDPNWGRIVAAVGYAGVTGLIAEKVDIFLDEVLIVENGGRAPNYTELEGQRVVSKPEFTIRVNLNMGDYSETLWTTDLSHEYIKINAEYRS